MSQRFEQVTTPVTLVWRMRDRCFTPSLARRLAAKFPNSSIVEAPEAKTFVPLDDPSAVISAITTVGAPSV